MRQAMSGKTVRSIRRLDELDAIVVSIFEAFESDGDERLDSRVRHLRQPSHQRCKTSASGKDQAASDRPSMEKPLAADEMMCPPDPEVEPEMGMIEEAESPTVNPSLFTGDEEEFVRRTVDWLSPRPNADIILDHIWALVVERTSGGSSADHQKMDDGSTQTPAASDPGEMNGEPENS